MTKKHVSLLVVFVLLFTTLFSSFVFAADKEEWVVADEITINAKAHVQSFGDQTYEPGEGMIAFGTEGKAKRLENFNLTLKGAPADMELVGMAHVQSFGDMPEKGFKAGEVGTKGLAKRIEGVAFKLVKKGTDTLYPGYRVGYAVHMQSFGWGISKDVNEVVGKNFKGADDFAFDGTFAGTRGLSKRIESVSLIIYKEAKLKVESVTALNLKQIEVKFNKDASAVRGNFLINGSAVAAADFTQSEDGTLVKLYNAANTVSGQKIRVTVTGIEGLDTAHYDLVLNDNMLPSVESVESVGNTLVKVTFSEPMNSGLTSISNFKIDGVVKSGTLSMNSDRTELSIALNAKLADGEHTLVVNATNVKDFAGNALGVNSTDFTIAKDAATPEFSVESATQEEIVVKFASTPKTVDTIYWKSGSTENHSAKGVVDAADSTKYTFTFSPEKRLPAGVNTVYMHKVTDYSGNISEDKSFTVTATTDTGKPEFVSLTQKDATHFELKFSKAVRILAGNYSLKDSKNVSVSLSAANFAYKDAGTTLEDKSIIVLTFTPNVARSPYTLVIKDVKDTTYLENRMVDVTVTFDVHDETPPTVSSVYKTGNVISVTFNEDITTADTTNFKYSIGGDFYSLPPAAYLTIVNNKTVNITFPTVFGPSNGHRVGIISSLYIANIADIAGNEMLATTQNVVSASSTIAVTGSVYAFDANTLYVAVDSLTGKLANIWDGDFVVMAGSEQLTVNSATLEVADSDVNKLSKTGTGHDLGFSTGDQIIKLVLDESLNANGTYTVDGVEEDVYVDTESTVTATVDSLDNPLAIGAAIKVVDKIVPVAPNADNYSLTTADGSEAYDLIKNFVANEPVTVEYLVQDNDETAVLTTTPRTGVDVTPAKAVFDRTDSTNGETLTAEPGDEVYIRFNDGANVTAWVKLGTIVPTTPSAKFVFTAESVVDGTLSEITSAYEYSIDGGDTWKAAEGITAALTGVSTAKDIKVRVKETTTVPASAIQTIDVLVQPEAPIAVFVKDGATGTNIVGPTDLMQYRYDGGAWTSCDADGTTTIATTTASKVIEIRVKASVAATDDIAPAGVILKHTLVASEIGA